MRLTVGHEIVTLKYNPLAAANSHLAFRFGGCEKVVVAERALWFPS
jgi:hypothetical protein